MIRSVWNRIRDGLSRDRLDRELDEELRFHRGLLERDARAAGAPADEATHAARRRLGNVTTLRESARALWGIAWVDTLMGDVRYALRGLARSPGFTAAVILTLGLGVGANAAMFGVIDRLMFRPLPYLHDPARVHRVYLRSTDRNREQVNYNFEYRRYLDLQEWTTSFDASAAFATNTIAVGLGDDAREMPVGTVSASFFSLFDARPALGRFFVAEEDSVPHGSPVAVLSYGFWKSRYGGRADVLRSTLQVGSVLCTIIGVAPEGFVGANDDTPPALYVPITTYAGSQHFFRGNDNYYTAYHWGWLEMLVRRKPGVTVAIASADLSHAYVRSWNAERETEQSRAPASAAHPNALASSIKIAAGPDPGRNATAAVWIGGVALIVLLIACANVANLQLTRALRRRREIAVRLALGVSRRRLMSQFLTESLLLALLGGVAGVLIAQWGGAALRGLFLEQAATAGVLDDGRTLIVAAISAIVAGLLAGTVPALYSVRADLSAALKAGTREGTHRRSSARTALLVVQGALSVVLLVGAGLFVRSLANVRALRMGYDVDPVLIAVRSFRGGRVSDAERIALGRRLLAAAQSTPGVESAAWVLTVPFWSTMQTDLYVPGIDSVQRLGQFTLQGTTPGYFQTVGTRVLRGRALTDADRAGAPLVAVVSESMARTLWPGKEAIGQCMKVDADTMPCTTVVGISEDIIQRSLTDDSGMHYYLPIEQFHPQDGPHYFVRVRGDPAAHIEGLRRRMQKEMSGASYVTVRTLRSIIDPGKRSWELGATMFTAFGGLALVLAAIGLYGVIAANVAQRTHEMGVRVALGAQVGDVVRLVVGEGVRLALVGVVIGGALAYTAGQWVAPLLYKESPHDPMVFGVVGVLLMGVAFVAALVPALRASRADPNLALKSD